MPEHQLGQLYAILTAFCWTISSTMFEFAGKRIGSIIVNFVRLIIAVAMLGLICLFTRGQFIPTDMPRHVFIWIVISGVIGFFLCDMCLFRALVLAGARRAMLMLSLAPCFAAVLDFAIGQMPRMQTLAGMAVTVTGVMWVIRMKSTAHEQPHSRRELRIGLLLALCAALFQAVGALAANIALKDRYDPLAATFVRAAAGMVAFGAVIAATGRFGNLLTGIKSPRPLLAVTIGALFGPVIGVTLFLTSISLVLPSVTQTILATIPVLMLPIAHFSGKDRITPGAVAGTIVAVTGVMILCWR